MKREAILGMAPDESSRVAAGRLAVPGCWVAGYGETGSVDKQAGTEAGALTAVAWGEYLRDGRPVYRVCAGWEGEGLTDFHCDCPSRKRPCKHVLGLLLLLERQAGESAGEFFRCAAPPWVDERLGRGRRSSARRVADVTGHRARARARRAAARDERVTAGLDELERWLVDLARGGIGRLTAAGGGAREIRDSGQIGDPADVGMERMAARLIDAQAPGLARMVRRMSLIPGSSADWPGLMLEKIGWLFLVIEAWRRLAELPPGLQFDLRATIGWPQRREDLAAVTPIRDKWLTLGQLFTVEDRLKVRRVWLWGKVTQRMALLLDYAVETFSEQAPLAAGEQFVASLSFFPSALELRAALIERQPRSTVVPALPEGASIAEALDQFASALGVNPWLEIFPMRLTGVGLARAGEEWAVVDAGDGGEMLPLLLSQEMAWRLLSVTGGRAVDLFGEWDGHRLRPVTVVIRNSGDDNDGRSEWIPVR